MPAWIVEIFANDELNQLFWLVSSLTAPFWLLMLFAPRSRVTRCVCHPWTTPPLLSFVYLYVLYLALTVTSVTMLPDVEMTTVRRFWGNPFLFIALWLHRMIVDLFAGIMIYRSSRHRRIGARMEMLLTWAAGPVGIMVFAVRYWLSSSDRK